MSDTPWPPEGTRVRIRDGSFLDGHEGIYDGEASVDSFHWVTVTDDRTKYKINCLVQRHEIEVIDE